MPTEAPPYNVSPSQDTSVIDFVAGLGKIGEDAPASPAPDPSPGPTDLPAPKPEPKAPAQAKAPEAKPEPTKEPEKVEDPPENKWPRTAQEWKKFIAARDEGFKKRESERDQFKTELETTKQEIEKLRKQGPSPELDTLRKERDELSEKLKLIDVREHPEFKRRFDGKTTAQLEMAKRIVGADKADKITALLKLPDSQYRNEQIEALSADLSVMQQGRLANVINALGEIESERDGEIAKAKADFERMKTEQGEKAKTEQAQFQAQSEKAFNELVKEAQEKNPLFQIKENDQEWNNGVKSRIEAAKGLLFGQTGQDTLMKAAMAAVSVPVIVGAYQGVVEENKKLQAQIKELTAAQPKVDAPNASNGQRVPIQVRNQSADPMQAAKDWLGMIQAPMEE